MPPPAFSSPHDLSHLSIVARTVFFFHPPPLPSSGSALVTHPPPDPASGSWRDLTHLAAYAPSPPPSLPPSPSIPLCQDLVLHPPPDPASGSRRDLTHLAAYTVDAETTEEVDDALSIEILDPSRSGSRFKNW